MKRKENKLAPGFVSHQLSAFTIEALEHKRTVAQETIDCLDSEDVGSKSEWELAISHLESVIERPTTGELALRKLAMAELENYLMGG